MAIAGLRRMLAVAGAALLAACAADTTVYYTPPPGLTPDHAVSLVGSKDPKYLIGSSEYHLCWAVDGRRVKDSAYRWDQPLLITAGEPHRLSLAYGWGAASGFIDVEFIGRPGTTVVVEGEAVDPDKLARLWLADAKTGAIVLAKQSVPLGLSSAAPPLALTTPYEDIVPLQAIHSTLPAMH